MPKAEIETHRPLFESRGLDVSRLFIERDERYMDFNLECGDSSPLSASASPVRQGGDKSPHSKAAVRDAVRNDPGVAARERKLFNGFQRWWRSATARLAALPETGDPMRMRAEWIESFGKALQRIGLLDRFQLVGALVSWWDEAADEIRTVAEQGFEELLDGWIDTIRDVLEDTENCNC